MQNNKYLRIICICFILGLILLLNMNLRLSNSLDELSGKIEELSIADNQSNLIKYNSLEEVADYLDLDLNTIKEIVENKDLNMPYIKLGDDYIFYKLAIDDWIKNVNIKKD